MGNSTANMNYRQLWIMMVSANGLDTVVYIVIWASPRVYTPVVLVVGIGIINHTAMMVGLPSPTNLVIASGISMVNYTVTEIYHP
jgi:hypothetical protein